ncbi:MAG: winged helix-turn-helix transcriptional regulator [Candidatus Hydrothermarchaeales archaeon]
MPELDTINKEILRLLCEDSRLQYSELQKRLAKNGHTITRETVEYRVKKMIDGGVIRKFAMITDPEKLGYQICCHLILYLDDSKDRDIIGEELAKLPNTAYVHSAAMGFDVACRIFFQNANEMIDFLDKLKADQRVTDLDMQVIRKTYKVGPISPP